MQVYISCLVSTLFLNGKSKKSKQKERNAQSTIEHANFSPAESVFIVRDKRRVVVGSVSCPEKNLIPPP